MPLEAGELFSDAALAWEDRRRARRFGRLPRDGRPYDWATDFERPVRAVPYDWSAEVVESPPRPRERQRREPEVLRPAPRPRREPARSRSRVQHRRRVLVIVVAALTAVGVIAQAGFDDGPTTPAPKTGARTAARPLAPRGADARATLARAKLGLAPLPAAYVAAAETGVAAASRAGRIPAAAATRAHQALALAANALANMPPAEAGALTTVLGHVAAHAREYDAPRALALFGMLETNARYLSAHALPLGELDIRGPDGIVYRHRSGEGFQFHPIANFAKLNELVTKHDAKGAARLARAIAARGVHQGDALIWEYYFPFEGHPRWTSGFAQAVGAQALARTSVLVHDRRLLSAARAAFAAMPARFAHKLGGGLWVREYSFSDMPILNSQLQTLLSVSEYARIARDPAAHLFAEQLAVASKRLLPRFSTGCWSLYSLGGHRASAHYHQYHLVLLNKLAATRSEPLWARMARRWHSQC